MEALGFSGFPGDVVTSILRAWLVVGNWQVIEAAPRVHHHRLVLVTYVTIGRLSRLLKITATKILDRDLHSPGTTIAEPLDGQLSLRTALAIQHEHTQLYLVRFLLTLTLNFAVTLNLKESDFTGTDFATDPDEVFVGTEVNEPERTPPTGSNNPFGRLRSSPRLPGASAC